VFALIVALAQLVHDQQLVCSPRSYISDQFDEGNRAMVRPGTIPRVGDVGLCTLTHVHANLLALDVRLSEDLEGTV
jgi:hypothetical protein